MDNQITVCPMCPDCPDNCPVEAEMGVPDTNVGDTISRQAAIDALWKALYEYEDKTEKQFQESEDLDVGDWIEHRIFVQNMNDIDRQTILNLPPAQPDLDEWCTDCKEYDQERHCCPRWNRVIRNALKDAQPEPKWIPVSKPPEYPGEFLCYYEVEEFGEVMHCIDFGRYDEDDGWYVSGVKYWMPLPDEPYERSEEW